MKKVKFEGKLSLKKEAIAKLNNDQLSQVNGGAGFWTTGCTDGCTTKVSFQTALMCTYQNCTADCINSIGC